MTIQPLTALLAVCWLVFINLETMRAFRSDKLRAIRGERRLSEADLLLRAAAGGTPGAFLARHLFRHKTRKQPFSLFLELIAVGQAGGLIGWFLTGG